MIFIAKSVSSFLRFLQVLLVLSIGSSIGYSIGVEAKIPNVNYLPADPNASQAAKNVFSNLKYLIDNNYFMFGQEFPTDFQWAKAGVLDDNPEDSDCKDVVGQHPGVFGSDFHYYLEASPREREIHLRSVKAAYARGALITFDWHLSSPPDRGGSFYVNDDNRGLLEEITSGMNEDGQCVDGPESMCSWYFRQVDQVLKIITDLNFTIAFRPLHEMTGFWFWWGNPKQLHPGHFEYNAFTSRYKKLYKALVEYTRAKGMHNLLYVWAPSNEANFDFYPGDNWVDIVGLDVYEQGTDYGPSIQNFKFEMAKLTDFAKNHRKIAVLAETGFRMGYPEVETKFWTENVLKPLLEGKKSAGIAWVLSWMNAQWERNPYIPYAGMQNKEAIADFLLFYKSPQTLFEGDFSGIETSNFVVKPVSPILARP